MQKLLNICTTHETYNREGNTSGLQTIRTDKLMRKNLNENLHFMRHEQSINTVPTTRLDENRTSNILIIPESISSLNRPGSNYSITNLTLRHTHYIIVLTSFILKFSRTLSTSQLLVPGLKKKAETYSFSLHNMQLSTLKYSIVQQIKFDFFSEPSI